MDNFPKLIQKQQKIYLLAPLLFHTVLEIHASTQEPVEALVTADGVSARLGN